ncbi:MAG: sigma54 specific transcriptional regulator Fis family [Ignavibacteria bacterium]|nr:MAG: sigma54 specific transcriptional regulator Fis family [Ignavibacteria bacterium]KAF0159305.1 MAG: sigma54 specific transcriptional regulator Fis family [Ignavibacteria bacterium]
MRTEEFQKKFGIIGKSKEIRDLVDIIMQVAKSDISVLVTGESGVGKEVFARAIHNFSTRSGKELVSVNCGAIPESLLESELFGHKKGSFTGATDDRKGYFEIADEGSLFLDEIAEMALTTQVKLLRVLETKEFMRIGGERVTKVDVRIIGATNKDLQREVDSKKFRHDLYFRLKAVTINIPPLRKRKGDIVELAKNFLENYTIYNRMPRMSLAKDAEEILINYNWPGNVRELKNVIETAVALSRSNVLDAEAFIPLLTTQTHQEEQHNLPVHITKTTEQLDREMIYRALIEIKKDLIDLKSLAANSQSENSSHIAHLPNKVVPFVQIEKQAIINALNFTKHNKRRSAQLLGISERTLYRKIREYEIE